MTLRKPSLLSEEPPAGQAARQEDEDRSHARDLNLDQIVAAVAGDREERDLITTVLYGRLHDAAAVRYRQEVFRDLEDLALLDAVRRFCDQMAEVRAHLRQLGEMRYRYQREGWLLDAAAIYCEAVHRWPRIWPRRQSAPAPCWASGTTSARMSPRPGSPAWPATPGTERRPWGRFATAPASGATGSR